MKIILRPFFIFLLIVLSRGIALSQQLDETFKATIKGYPRIEALGIQSDGKILIGGDITISGNTPVDQLVRLNTDGSLDKTFIPTGIDDGFIDKIIPSGDSILLIFQYSVPFSVFNLNSDQIDSGFQPDQLINRVEQAAISGDKYILSFYSSDLGIAVCQVNRDGSIDNNFQTGVIGGQGGFPNIDVQEDRKILLWTVYNYNGEEFNGIIRLNQDGTVDKNFDIDPIHLKRVVDMDIQNDGKILLLGDTGTTAGVGLPIILRLNIDGSLDQGFHFDADIFGNNYSLIQVQPLSDGSIVAGYFNFSMDDYQYHYYLEKLNGDGSLDSTFNKVHISDELNSSLQYLLLKAGKDNSVYFVGEFFKVNGEKSVCFGAVDENGNVFKNFDPGFGANPSGSITSVACQNDGKVIIGGDFFEVNGQDINNLVRLNPDGSIDTDFNPDFTTSHFDAISSLALQHDGKIIIGGRFYLKNSPGGNFSGRLARLNTDGTLDQSFKANLSITHGYADRGVRQIIVGPMDTITICGSFDIVNGENRHGIARLNPDGSLLTSYNSQDIIPVNNLVEAIDTLAGNKLFIGGEYIDSNSGFLGLLDENGNWDENFSLKDHIICRIKVIRNINNHSVVYGGSLYGGSPIDPIPLYLMNVTEQSGDSTAITISGNERSINDVIALNGQDLLVGGSFTTINNSNYNGLGRVSIQGKVAPEFVLNVTGLVSSIEKYDRHSIIVAGGFSQINGIQKNGIAKITDIDFSQITGLSHNEAGLHNILLYPNPSGNILTIAHKSSYIGPLKLIIYTVEGQILRNLIDFKQENDFHYAFDLERVPPGIYLLKMLFSDGKSVTKTFIKR